MDITVVGYVVVGASALGLLALLGLRMGASSTKKVEDSQSERLDRAAPPQASAEVARPPRPTDPSLTASRGGNRPTPSSSLGSTARPAATRAPRNHPTQVGPYTILGLVGEGAMASVYKAEDPNTKQIVALKLVQEGLQKDPEFVARFQREMVISRALVHPNIVKVFESGAQEDGQLYMTMELVDGQNLDEMLKAGGPMPLSQVGRIAGQLVDGLHYAHQRDLVHRDIKPSNIMVNKNGIPKLLDFGLALQQGMNRFTTVGASMGTPTHMAPETLTTGNSDKKSDQYALGICIFQMLTGVCPFTGPDAMNIAMQHVKSQVPSIRALREEVPPRLEAIVNRMLKKNPEERYPTLTQLQMEIVSSV